MRADVGIIGGTGIGDRLLARGGTPIHVPTEAGWLRARVIDVDGVRIAVAGRHSAGHKVPPHRVNYHAITLGMRALGVKACLSTAAVGCLRTEWSPGTLVACSDFLDFTGRTPTLFDRTVIHRDFTDPFGSLSRRAILRAAEDLGESVEPRGIYLCLNGPRYETPQEIALYAQFGADVVGMTAATEAILMREAGVDYGCLAIVTNMASGIAINELSHEEVVDEMKRSGPRSVNLLLAAAKRIANAP
jgi:5'-methylthioadenosine phosphorylase